MYIFICFPFCVILIVVYRHRYVLWLRDISKICLTSKIKRMIIYGGVFSIVLGGRGSGHFLVDNKKNRSSKTYSK